MVKKERKLTLQGYYTRCKWSRRFYPSLLLSGKWLLESGFNPQDQVIVTVKTEKLIIERQKK